MTALNQCKYLSPEYIGRYHGAICRNDDPKKCPRKHKTAKNKVNVSCFNLLWLNNPTITQEPTCSQYGNGEPNAVAPEPVEKKLVLVGASQ